MINAHHVLVLESSPHPLANTSGFQQLHIVLTYWFGWCWKNLVFFLIVLGFRMSDSSHSAKWEVPATFLGRAKDDEGMDPSSPEVNMFRGAAEEAAPLVGFLPFLQLLTFGLALSILRTTAVFCVEG